MGQTNDLLIIIDSVHLKDGDRNYDRRDDRRDDRRKDDRRDGDRHHGGRDNRQDGRRQGHDDNKRNRTPPPMKKVEESKAPVRKLNYFLFKSNTLFQLFKLSS